MMNRKLKFEEMELVTGNGDLFMKHWFQERKEERAKKAEEERNALNKTF